MSREHRGNAPVVFALLWCVLTSGVLAQGVVPPTQPSAEAGVPVIYRGQEIVRIRSSIGAIGPAQRAQMATQRLNQAVSDPGFDPTRITVTDRETNSELLYEDRIIAIVTDDDARIAGRPRPEVARQLRDRLIEVIATTRDEFSVWSIVIGIGWSLLTTIILVVLLRLSWRLGRMAEGRMRRRIHRLTGPAAERGASKPTRLASLMHDAFTIANIAVVVVFMSVWVQIVLHVLPWSRPIARLVYSYASAPLRTFWTGLMGIVPNIFYLAVIAVMTFVVTRLVRVVFREIEVGNIRLASFPGDWAEPTYKLVRTLLIAIAVVGAVPYIPGSRSPAFEGISLFLGLLVSLSSSSAVSNIIAGIILTYTQAFRLGDIVHIGETLGEVTTRRLLVTNVRSFHNVVVTIPNSVILTTQVLNYTTLARERGLILHTTVTIGYDTPWQRVHQLLIAAASRTEGVLGDPLPFVLQTALNDYSVSYELNAFVASAGEMRNTYSDINANIQARFNEAGVEIMSPQYLALRDGNPVTIPRQSPGGEPRRDLPADRQP